MFQPKRLTLMAILALNLILILFYRTLSSLSLQPHHNDAYDARSQQQPKGGNSQQQQKSSTNKYHNYEKGRLSLPTFDPKERYLAYLPHAGFHNQRISLENSLLLAKYLNRTLLVPPVFLGPATEWRPFDVLLRRIQLQTKRGLDHCDKISKADPLPAECLNYYSWTSVEWDFFYDMEKIRQQQPFKLRKDHSWAWLESHLGIDRHKDVYIIQDRAHYDYQIFDDPQSTTLFNKDRYMRRLELQELADRPERVLHMGSMFATGRVMAELPHHKEYQQFLRRTMILTTPILVKTSDTIVSKLGGLGTFIGLHVRVGDGMFVEPAPRNIAAMFNQLVNLTGIVPIEEEETFVVAANTPEINSPTKQGLLPEASSSSPSSSTTAPSAPQQPNSRQPLQPRRIQQQHQEQQQQQQQHQPLQQPRQKQSGGTGGSSSKPATSKGTTADSTATNNHSSLSRVAAAPAPVPVTSRSRPQRLTVQECVSRKSQGGMYTTIYIATDGMYPRKNKLFRRLFAHFPCIFTLDDFFAEDLKELKELKNTDGVGLGRDLIPMVDAVVSAKGRYFMGTPKSTFSTYVSKQLHPIYVEHLYDKDGNPVPSSPVA